MADTFAEKFEAALAEKREQEPNGYGLRTLARALAKDDPQQTEIIRRRLHKYRPPKGGGSAEVSPTAPTRREIEDAMGLEPDALKPEPREVAASAVFLREIAPLHRLWQLGRQIDSGEIIVTRRDDDLELV